ncbi:hypothetical protein F3Y22_tig00110828pilonHSYRG00181 [Hibiscus syriacus]|uniref:RNase H type-1 domain-containing protein n=1 Tax=Hibiscus syriacus TaxID=106335 RepID=A0A6A2ZN37_HIBSY|nr:hypothetical protein F3Y22_tig00110828pilonHSYRG00181 [Hibiscus syriacus]
MIHTFQANHHQQASRAAMNQQWCAFKTDFLKLNTDATINHAILEAAGGGGVRDSKGEWVVGYCRSIGCCSPLYAELWALFDGLDLA